MIKIFKYRSICILAIIASMVIGCSESNTGFLDPDTSDSLNKEVVFGDSIYTYRFHAKLYRHLEYTYNADNGIGGGGIWSWGDMADDSKNKWSGASQTSHRYNMNSITDPNEYRMRLHWKNSYEGISRVNIFLENIEISPLQESTKIQLKAEARLVRAWLYFHLLRLYGGVPITYDKVYGLTDKVEEPRSTFADLVEYIVSECDELKDILPNKQTGHNYGRMTSGAAYAIKARVLHFAASPLSNGSVPTDNEELIPLLGYTDYDKNRWKRSAEAAKDVINLNRYELIEDDSAPGRGFYKMQIERVNKEYIFPLMKNGKYFEWAMLPNSRGGQVYASPFQGLVDAFPMNNGKSITDPDSGFDKQQPYQNRDPRLDYTILHEGSMWIPNKGSMTAERLSFAFNVKDDGVGIGATKTGYAFRKFCSEEATGGQGSNINVMPFIRLAEIYLNYAEAMNEYDPANKQEIEKHLIAIRKRAGILPGSDNRYGLPTTYTQEEMRMLLQNERRCEFALEEGHRFFDLKRWAKLEEAKNNVDFYGIKWSKYKEGEIQTYEPLFVETHKFDPTRQYYYPIPPSEINIVGVELLKQNPGW